MSDPTFLINGEQKQKEKNKNIKNKTIKPRKMYEKLKKKENKNIFAVSLALDYCEKYACEQ